MGHRPYSKSKGTNGRLLVIDKDMFKCKSRNGYIELRDKRGFEVIDMKTLEVFNATILYDKLALTKHGNIVSKEVNISDVVNIKKINGLYYFDPKYSTRSSYFTAVGMYKVLKTYITGANLQRVRILGKVNVTSKLNRYRIMGYQVCTNKSITELSQDMRFSNANIAYNDKELVIFAPNRIRIDAYLLQEVFKAWMDIEVIVSDVIIAKSNTDIDVQGNLNICGYFSLSGNRIRLVHINQPELSLANIEIKSVKGISIHHSNIGVLDIGAAYNKNTEIYITTSNIGKLKLASGTDTTDYKLKIHKATIEEIANC